jgi:hypothetical protein
VFAGGAVVLGGVEVGVGAGVVVAEGVGIDVLVEGLVVTTGGAGVLVGPPPQTAVAPGGGQVEVGQHAKELPSALKQVKGRDERGSHLQRFKG